MNALEIHKILHKRVKIGQAEKTPEIQKNNPLYESPDLIPDSHPSNVNQSRSSFLLIK
jgi:hypothetical protein